MAEDKDNERDEPKRGRPAKADADAPVVQIQESAESFKARKFAEAMQAAGDMDMDETVPGGVYRDQYGRMINANGQPIEVSGVERANHSGELRDKAEVKS